MYTIKKIISFFIFLFIFLHTQQVFSYSYSEGKNAYDNKNYAKAFRIWYLLSLDDDPQGKFGMGLLYKNGFDQLDPSCEYALQYLSSAEINGINDASYELGDIFEVGKLCKKNKNKALTYYEKVAKNNHLESINRLAESYENGTLGPKDQNKSCAYSDQAANLGDAIGQYRAAKCYKYNLAGKRDFDKAINLLETVANQKIDISNDAKLELVNSDKFNDKLSCEWNEKLHQQDYMKGTYETALCLKYSKAGEKNFDKAIKYLTLAKDTHGENELFKVYFKTTEINCDWYQILHQNNYTEGSYNLAECYRKAEGRNENFDKARKILHTVIKDTDYQYICKARLALAQMLIKGEGGEIELTLADSLLELIIKNTNRDDDECYDTAKSTGPKIKFGWDQCKTELDAMNYTKKTKEICIEAADNGEYCAMRAISQLYKEGVFDDEDRMEKSRKWNNIADSMVSKVANPQSGFHSGFVEECD